MWTGVEHQNPACSVTYSKLLYGALAWKRALGHEKYDGREFPKNVGDPNILVQRISSCGQF